ncbi:helix-turn-helix transcriptional regulator [Frankia nepalensis]|uniref:AAA family ATPase n=1 Tax=Frankia nepalensis TaxID=1836974 RepID=A0A937RKM5_9ACTN|nr:LuxR family transcriptional regulator [Frankia nepalensis]MBL7499062.1 AAA family ATPase [Frankia nepalensis]MBL7514498.1 AAA family ATPase [Frankia nepalensis]MBL7632030.1 AAA family ATPase [Frankia nepalensis]
MSGPSATSSTATRTAADDRVPPPLRRHGGVAITGVGVRTPAAPSGGPTGRWPLTGRDRELAAFRRTVRDPGRAAFCASAAEGVGKTRLADECLTWAARENLPVLRVAASRAAANLPLGALRHLARHGAATPGDGPPPTVAPGVDAAGVGGPSASPGPDVVAVMAEVRAAMRAVSGRRRLILVVDDFNLLDSASVCLVSELVAAGEVFLTATLRRGEEPVPDLLERLWSGDRAEWIDLAPLERADVDLLLARTMGGPATADTCAVLWEASLGNPLILRELVLGALRGGCLVVEEGVWRLTGEPAPTPRLHGLVEGTLAAVTPAEVDLLERLSVVGRLSMAALGAAGSVEALESLERRGLVQVHQDGRRRPVTLAHPVFARSIQDRMPRAAVERILAETARHTRATGARRRDDAREPSAPSLRPAPSAWSEPLPATPPASVWSSSRGSTPAEANLARTAAMSPPEPSTPPNAVAVPAVEAVWDVHRRVSDLLDRGQVGDAVAAGLHGPRLAAEARASAAHVACADLLGRCHLAAGRPVSAIRWFREAAVIARVGELEAAVELVHSGLALAHAYLGDEAEASRALERGGAPAGRGLNARAHAWHLALRGDSPGAIASLLAAADADDADGDPRAAAEALYDVARLGRPADVAARLQRLSETAGSALVTTAARHAGAAASRDAAALAAVATEFEAVGAYLFAAEAAADAQRCPCDPRRRAALVARAATLAQRCEHAHTPSMLGLATVVPLSRREREICALAARGLSSRDIAARLVLSIRTVDNHLQRAYRKLGVTRRDQLADALALPSAPR